MHSSLHELCWRVSSEGMKIWIVIIDRIISSFLTNSASTAPVPKECYWTMIRNHVRTLTNVKWTRRAHIFAKISKRGSVVLKWKWKKSVNILFDLCFTVSSASVPTDLFWTTTWKPASISTSARAEVIIAATCVRTLKVAFNVVARADCYCQLTEAHVKPLTLVPQAMAVAVRFAISTKTALCVHVEMVSRLTWLIKLSVATSTNANERTSNFQSNKLFITFSPNN